jgi:ribosome-associated heat shock protein Hsp15
MADSVRIDKYLWAIRVFKTRSDATDACNGNKVQIGGVNAKPSKAVKAGDLITVRKGAVQYSYKVISTTENRMGAALVPQYAENLTPESELENLHAPAETFFVRRERGSGRPTKKERREMDALWDAFEDR